MAAPRYVVIDTGTTASMLDRAQQQWPEVAHRKELLLRLAAVGCDVIEACQVEVSAPERRKTQRDLAGTSPSRDYARDA